MFTWRSWEVGEWSPMALVTMLVGGRRKEMRKSAYRLLDVAKELPRWEFWMIHERDGSRDDRAAIGQLFVQASKITMGIR